MATIDSSERPIDVLVVDDSAVVRQLLTAILTDAGMEVRSAADPVIAQRKMRQQRPDVMVLDLEMPRMHGITFLDRIMTEDPLPVIVCSGATGPGTERALEALRLGAIEVMGKPSLGVREFFESSAAHLVEVVEAACQSSVRTNRLRRPTNHERAVPPEVSTPLPPPTVVSRTSEKTAALVAVGVSTGGPQALENLLGRLPADAPALLIVQHMPSGFTKALAERLNRMSALRVKEAQDGDVVRSGVALLAPGDHHMEVFRDGRRLVVRLNRGPLVSRHRPSADVLFHSVARAVGGDAIGVLLTGMGSDGVEGMEAMRDAGALTLAQDAESCVVYGMPKEALQRGAAVREVTLEDLPRVLVDTVS